MSSYQTRRPSRIQILSTRAKRQEAGLDAVGPGSEEEGPESPDSPDSSPSTTGAPSPGDSSNSDDDDEPSSPKKSSASTITTQALSTSTTSSSPTLSASTSSSRPSSTTSTRRTVMSMTLSTSTLRSLASPSFTQMPTSQDVGAIAPPPGAIATSAMIITTTRLSSTVSPTSSASPTFTSSGTTQLFSSKIARPTQPLTTTVSLLLLPPPPGITRSPAEDNDAPKRTRPEPTLMSKGAEAAAITLSIIGAIALVVGVLLYCRRRRRRRNEKLEAELERDAANYAAIRAPETAHINNAIAPFATSGPHITQSTDRSNNLFAPGSYSRLETVSITRGQSRISVPQPTPNPFADPPLNKAYDVLAGRPRSTTLTDRGSWVKNPFKNPESERFDPFGELQAKARRERVKQVEIARKEAELERQFEAKEKMGLVPPEWALDRKGSGVTLEGLGVLDRSDGGAYR